MLATATTRGAVLRIVLLLFITHKIGSIRYRPFRRRFQIGLTFDIDRLAGQPMRNMSISDLCYGPQFRLHQRQDFPLEPHDRSMGPFEGHAAE